MVAVLEREYCMGQGEDVTYERCMGVISLK
jgi:hypothetical protein